VNASVRRAVAYIAGRAVSGRRASSAYDFSSGKYTNFSGEVSDSKVAVYDFDAGCHVSGSRRGDRYSLYHYGISGHIDLSVKPNGTFSGYDYTSAAHFSGKVTGRSISLYDHGSGEYFNYSI
jgi:hypothetical protein